MEIESRSVHEKEHKGGKRNSSPVQSTHLSDKRTPLPYECLQFVLQDHNYGAPPPRTPPPQQMLLHVKQHPIDPDAKTCITVSQNSIPFNQNESVKTMTVDDDANSAISSEAGREIEPEGEETETAPEGEGDDEDSVTRCICDFEHDDGYMICCDRCLVWQHVDCMGIDRSNIPDEYLCELCQPRRVDRARARALQMRKREELLNSDTSSDSSSISSNEGDITHNMTTKNRRILQQQITNSRIKSDASKSNNNNNVSTKQKKDGSTRQANTPRNKKETVNSTVSSSLPSTTAILTMTATIPSVTSTNTTPSTTLATIGSGKQKGLVRRKSKRCTSVGDKDEIVQEAKGVNVLHLKQWIEKYEEAVTNHYSPELRARISNIKVNSLQTIDFKQCNTSGPINRKYRLNIQSNNSKFLVASMYLPPNTPVIELRGKYMLSTQHRPTHVQGRQHSQRPGPFVFFYRLPRDGTEVCVDTRTYGNDARFIRRSCKANSEIKHYIEKGTLHLYIVTSTAIEKNTEITIRHDEQDLALLSNSNSTNIPLICACNESKDCQVINLFSPNINRKGNNGSLLENNDGKERRRRGRGSTLNEESNDTFNAVQLTLKENATSSKTETPEQNLLSPTKKSVLDSKIITRDNQNKTNISNIKTDGNTESIVINIGSTTTVTRLSIKPENRSLPAHLNDSNASLNQAGSKTSTNNESSSQFNVIENKKEKKKMTREERKMEAIIKAFERLEKAEQRKQEAQARNAQRKESITIQSDNEDSGSQSVNKTKQSGSDKIPRRKRRKGRTRSISASQSLSSTRRIRLTSGESDLTSGDETNLVQSPRLSTQNYSLSTTPIKNLSNTSSQSTAASLLLALANSNSLNCNSLTQQIPSVQQQQLIQQSISVKSPSGDSGASSSSQSSTPSTPLSSACLLVAAAVGPLAPGFKFPKTKKLLMNEWLKEEQPSKLSDARDSDTIISDQDQSAYLSQNYATKSLATLVQAAHSVSSESPSQHGKQGFTIVTSAAVIPTVSNASAKKRWLRQAISEECESPCSYRPDSPPSEMVAPPKKRRRARESLSSDNYTPPTTPTMAFHENLPLYQTSANEEDTQEPVPFSLLNSSELPNKSDSNPQQELIDSTVSKSKEVQNKETELITLISSKIPKVKCLEKNESFFHCATSKILQDNTENVTDIVETHENKTINIADEVVDNSQYSDALTANMNSPLSKTDSPMIIKKQILKSNLKFNKDIVTTSKPIDEVTKIPQYQDNLTQLKGELNLHNNMAVTDYDFEAEMKKITGDDGCDYKEKFNTNSEKDKNINGIEGLMESSKEDSESDFEDKSTDDFKDYKIFKDNDNGNSYFKHFYNNCKNTILKEKFKSTKNFKKKLEIQNQKSNLTDKESLDSIEKELAEHERLLKMNKVESTSKLENDDKSSDFNSEKSLQELNLLNLSPEKQSDDETCKTALKSIPPLSERIRKKNDNPMPKSKLEIEASIIESSLHLKFAPNTENNKEKILSSALRELLEAEIENDNSSQKSELKILHSNIIEKQQLNDVLEKNNCILTSEREILETKPESNIVIPTNELSDGIHVKTKEILPSESTRLKDPRTVVPNKLPTPSPIKIDGPPIKRKLSISEYRKRKQQITETSPELEYSETCIDDNKNISRDRSNSASSETSSLSSDEEISVKTTLEITSSNVVPNAHTELDEKKSIVSTKSNEEGTIGWSAAPTLVERQRENLTERLKREFGLFLNDDEEEKSRKQGFSNDGSLKTSISTTSNPGVNNSNIQLPPQTYIPPPGSGSIHFAQYSNHPLISTTTILNYPSPSVKLITSSSSTTIEGSLSHQVLQQSSSLLRSSTRQQQPQFTIPQAPPGSNPYPPVQFSEPSTAIELNSVNPPLPVPPPTTTPSISRFSSTPVQQQVTSTTLIYSTSPASQKHFLKHPISKS